MKQVSLFILLILTSCLQAEGFGNISADRAYEIINHPNSQVVILDIRTPEEYESGHIEGALNIDYYNENFKSELEKLDPEKQYLVYCRSGSRSGNSMQLFEIAGLKKVYNMRGGINSWKERGYPLK